MGRTHSVVSLVVLWVGLAHSVSWEYVIVATNFTLEFYKDSTLTHSESFVFGIKHLTYDAVQNRLLFLDDENTQNIYLHSLNLATMARSSFFMRKYKQNTDFDIFSLAYDPVTELVYFSDTYGIYWFSLKPGFKNDINYGHNLIASNHNRFSAIAVDSCRGFIYWMYKAGTVTKIERARLNGSHREIVHDNDQGGLDHLVVDQQTQKLYWINQYDVNTGRGTPYAKQFSIESINLKGEVHLDVLYSKQIYIYTHAKALTVSKEFIYWMDESTSEDNTVWKLQKNGKTKSEKKYTNSFLKVYNLVVANYNIEDQTRGVQDCEALISKNSVSNSLNVPTNETRVCQNYCIRGNCSIIEGHAVCRCDAGYSGDRSQVNSLCQGYCLNDGDCYLNEDSKPVCQCKGDYGGKRCDVSLFLMKCFRTVSMLKDILNTDVTPVSLDYGVKSTCSTTVF